MSWRKVKLGELVDNFSVRAKDVGGADGLDFFGVSNDLGIIKTKYAAEDKAEDYKIIEKGCFAYNPYRVNVGSIGLVSDDMRGLISPAYVVFKPKHNSIIPELLFKFLKSSEGLRQIIFYARGTVRQALRFEDLCNIEISIPIFSEQNNLYKKLINSQESSNVSDKKLKNQLELVKKLRQQLLQDAMQGKLVEQNKKDEPASELLKKIKAEKEKLIVEKKLKKEKELPPIKPEEIPFEIPESWVWCRLGEIGINCDGKRIPLSMSERSRRQGQFDYYGAQGVIDQIDDFKFDGTFLLIAEDGQNLLRKNKEVAFTASGKFWVNNHAHVTDFFDNSTMMFTKWYINSISLKPFISGKPPSQIKLKRSQLDLIPLPLPPLEEQNRIIQKVEELMQYCNDLEASIKESQQQNERLLQQVLREALRKEELTV